MDEQQVQDLLKRVARLEAENAILKQQSDEKDQQKELYVQKRN